MENYTVNASIGKVSFTKKTVILFLGFLMEILLLHILYKPIDDLHAQEHVQEYQQLLIQQYPAPSLQEAITIQSDPFPFGENFRQSPKKKFQKSEIITSSIIILLNQA